MSNIHREIHFEEEVCEHLAANGWLYSANDKGYDVEHAMFPEDLFAWIEETQPTEWAKVVARQGTNARTHLIGRLVERLEKDGTLALLRHGVKDVNATFSLCAFRPATSLNPDAMAKYNAVRLRVMRQVHYSAHNGNSIDLVFFVNGIPVATAELKTNFTQSIDDAVRQYQEDRLPRDPSANRNEPLLQFKRGALVHFAVSTDEVHMTTRLAGNATQFLPFNRGNDGGAGNPPNPTGYRTAYLWEQILQRDTWLNIIGRYAHLERKTTRERDGRETTRESLIFPRYHQWESVSALVNAARVERAGRRYLIQHSAGSGKTNSISWLAHQLAGLHGDDNAKVFDSVIVITDRTVLDSQLQEAIYQFEHKSGVVRAITSESGSKSAQLAEALTDNTPIIIVTIQTFPFVIDAIQSNASLNARRYAIIADEAHSSQSGNASKMIKKILSTEQAEEEEEVSVEDVLLSEMTARASTPNISYFAFTATPKAKTLQLFGRIGESGLPESFHVYSMQQAIEEGFILDVLQNYTTYKLAFRLAHNGQDYDDEQVDQSRALTSLMRWVRLHPYNIAQKVQIIVEHFRANIVWRLNGHAKAMVVTGSRKEAVRYKIEIDRYIRDHGYTDVRTLVAFSGDVIDTESGPNPFNETNMNPGLRGRDLRTAFSGDDYNVMLVANKFQTGFDQPLLMAMYVDKRLSGVTAVQTLSRLNRIFPGKTAPYTLDFVNEPDEILASFQPYYRVARLSGVTDPNLIHDLQNKLDASLIYDDETIDRFVNVWRKKGKQRELQAIIAPAVERFRKAWRAAAEADDKTALDALELFRKDLAAFVRAYDFLSQLVDYGDTTLEKRSVFYRFLLPLIEGGERSPAIDLSAVEMTHYQLRDLGERKLQLAGSEDSELSPLTGLGTGETRDPALAKLSEVIQQMNKIFEGELTDADLLNYATHIRDRMLEDDRLRQQAVMNTRDQFSISGDFTKVMIDSVIGGLDSYESMARQVLSSDNVQSEFRRLLVNLVYDAVHKQTKSVDNGGDDSKPPTSTIEDESLTGDSPPKVETRFSSYYPRVMAPAKRYTLLVYAHRDDLAAAIAADAEKFVSELGGEVRPPIQDNRLHSIAVGTPLTIVPECEGISFEPSDGQTKHWNGEQVRFNFDMVASPAALGKFLVGRVGICIFGIEIASLQLVIEVRDADGGAATVIQQTAAPYSRIFVSYSHDDTDVVQRYSAAQRARGDDVFVDVESIRSGEYWEERITEEILRADLFQLFWSTHSAASRYVEYEWREALKRQKSSDEMKGFIRPVYWVKPLAPPPPADLSHIHFAFAPLAAMQPS